MKLIYNAVFLTLFSAVNAMAGFGTFDPSMGSKWDGDVTQLSGSKLNVTADSPVGRATSDAVKTLRAAQPSGSKITPEDITAYSNKFKEVSSELFSRPEFAGDDQARRYAFIKLSLMANDCLFARITLASYDVLAQKALTFKNDSINTNLLATMETYMSDMDISNPGIENALKKFHTLVVAVAKNSGAGVRAKAGRILSEQSELAYADKSYGEQLKTISVKLRGK